MLVKSLALKQTVIENNVFIAPMAGYTNFAFRNAEIDFGAGLTFTELVSAKGLYYGGNGSKELLFICDENTDKKAAENYRGKTAAQIFGSDPFYMRAACESKYLENFDIVDINMGCPVPKVYKNGEGSALLADINQAEKVVKECVKSGKIITVKIRTGLKEGDDVAAEFAKMAENSGAALITVHGRVREAYYSGEPDFAAIERAKAAVKIPVIANGGIFTEDDANKMIDRTGADGVMLARGAIADPFLVATLTKSKANMTLKTFVLRLFSSMLEYYGEKRTVSEFKKFAAYYIKGNENSKQYRTRFMQCDNSCEMLEILNAALS